MKRFMVICLIGTIILSLAMPQAQATQTEDVEANVETSLDSDFTDEELDKVLTQDSPWYFIKRIFERVNLILTFRQEAKTELLADLANERAKEYAALEKKYDGEDIDEDQLKLLEQALKEMLKFTEKYMEKIIEEEDDEEVPPVVDEEEVEGDKYQQRIAHLKRIAERAPESAQSGLSRAIANAHRQRARMIAKGKLYDPDTETQYSPFEKFDFKIKEADRKLQVEYKESKDELEAKVEVKQSGAMNIELKGYMALEYLLPIFAEMNVDASLPQEEIISTVLTAFGWTEAYDELKIKIKFNDGTKIEIEIPEDEESNPLPPTNLAYKEFELELEAKDRKLEVEYKLEEDEIEAEVKAKQKNAKDNELKGAKALDYLLPILEGLKLDPSMPKADILNALLAAFGWGSEYEEVKLKVQFNDGKKLELEWKDKDDKEIPQPITGIPFKSFKLEIESDHKKLEVELKLKNDKYEAKVEIEEEEDREFELKGKKALDYLLPIFNKLKLNPSMSDTEMINALLKAFNWKGSWEEIEAEIRFLDGTKVKLEKELDD